MIERITVNPNIRWKTCYKGYTYFSRVHSWFISLWCVWKRYSGRLSASYKRGYSSLPKICCSFLQEWNLFRSRICRRMKLQSIKILTRVCNDVFHMDLEVFSGTILVIEETRIRIRHSTEDGCAPDTPSLFYNQKKLELIF